MKASLGVSRGHRASVSYLQQRTQQLDPLRVQPVGGQSTVRTATLALTNNTQASKDTAKDCKKPRWRDPGRVRGEHSGKREV